jgi:HK97 family phage prohead protease
METRIFEESEVRVIEVEGKPLTIHGLAAPYDKESRMMVDKASGKKFIEKIAPKAFNRILSTKPETRCNVNHAGGLATLGRTGSGTLLLTETRMGLEFDCVPPNTNAGRDAVELTKRGDLPKCSFAFVPAANGEEWSRNKDGVAVRTLTDFKSLEDVCITDASTAAYPDTSVALRSLDAFEALEKRAEPPADPGKGERERLGLLLALETRDIPAMPSEAAIDPEELADMSAEAFTASAEAFHTSAKAHGKDTENSHNKAALAHSKAAAAHDEAAKAHGKSGNYDQASTHGGLKYHHEGMATKHAGAEAE